MSKHIKRLVITVITLFALLGVGSTVAFAGGYIQWGGTGDYHEVLENLKLIKDSGSRLKDDLNKANHSKEELKVIIEQKEVIIQQKHMKFPILKKKLMI